MTRGSVRLRLTLLFASLFLASGAGLLGITYGLVSTAQGSIIVARINASTPATGAGPAGSGATGSGSASSGDLPVEASGGLGTLPDPSPLQEQATRYATDTRARENDALLLYSGIALGIMAVVAGLLGWLVAGRALRPLRRITESARRISATNLHERLALDGPDDDLRELADMIDGLFARLDASLQAQRQFVANASHELRTPLARSRTLLEVALRNPDASTGSLRAACERALAAGSEQERLIEALLALARGQRGLASRVPLDLAAITRDVLAARGGQITASGLTMEVTLKPGLLGGDEAQLERAVGNLVDNALRHNAPGGTVWISADAEDDRASLTIANTGPEISPEDVARLLQPFQRGGAAGVRTRRPGPDDGLGLGLSIVAAIATAHEADLALTPRLTGGGLSVRLTFPAPAAPPAPAAEKPPASVAAPALALRRPLSTTFGSSVRRVDPWRSTSITCTKPGRCRRCRWPCTSRSCASGSRSPSSSWSPSGGTCAPATTCTGRSRAGGRGSCSPCSRSGS
jgi:signal transduction histidine kinase